MKYDRFHGRVSGSGRPCEAPGCEEAGEFRAPGMRPGGFDGPGEWRWFCLDHVREFNSGYDWFEGMTAEEILDAQSPVSGWSSETRAFRPSADADAAPRWADFDDPLDAISARARMRRNDYARAQEATGRGIPPDERRAFEVLGLGFDADRKALRSRYSALVRKYHPDRNGGDRSHEGRLQQVVDAYQKLKKSARFG
ncbi:DnaJ domain-containing protein [Novosphingobium sp. ZN18A2]|uniref:J domain-containing protein n=1 Tax=Novosphingobium sp. ZN18A2 TaxID=3079861 RepID=UPI0030D13BB1